MQIEHKKLLVNSKPTFHRDRWTIPHDRSKQVGGLKKTKSGSGSLLDFRILWTGLCIISSCYFLPFPERMNAAYIAVYISQYVRYINQYFIFIYCIRMSINTKVSQESSLDVF